MRLATLACTVLLLVSFGAAAPVHASTVPLPNSIASTGDSITRAFDINWWHVLSDSPQYSWSTGDSTSVDSQYRRLLALNSAIAGHEYNDAKTGAKMADLDGQVITAASQKVDYLTILMGSNDLCTSSKSTMTPAATFRSEFQTALHDFFSRNPNAHVYVSSLPNLYQLWSVLHGYWQAESTWTALGICQSMLSIWNSDADRQAVVAQEVADNQALQSVCSQYANCRWDNGAGYNVKFPASDISTVDYFHPNLQGQNLLAAVTWAAGYWGS
jgi:lysophospholipase L1-like esterase